MIFDMIFMVPKRIATIQIGVELEETHLDELQITEHPVEKGAEINDHAFKRQPELTLKCGWSNSQIAALAGTLQSIFEGGELPTADYVSTVYSQLLALQETRQPFDVVTSLRIYRDMLFKSLSVTKDQKTGAALNVTATLKQIRIVQTQATSLPSKEGQADPQATAETQNAGVKAAVPATPAPGGSVPPTSM
ncbi:phage baseplate protein [Cupriavidus plantarum]|uniref:phage baseplate protein n=1 Tax=Cupriavidus plantarum TaxID=942865 RepID=UPI00339D3EB0